MNTYSYLILLSLFASTINSNDPKNTSSGIFPYNPTTDKETITQIIVDNYTDIVSASPIDNNKKHRAEYGKWLAETLHEKNCLVYKENGKTIGYIGYRTKLSLLPGYGSSGSIAQMGILKSYRGKNYGKKLLEAAREDMKKDPDLRAIFVMTTGETVADKFYKPNGFKNYQTTVSAAPYRTEHYILVEFIKKPYSKEVAEKLLKFCLPRFLRR